MSTTSIEFNFYVLVGKKRNLEQRHALQRFFGLISLGMAAHLKIQIIYKENFNQEIVLKGWKIIK